jgi:hypothetical protein
MTTKDNKRKYTDSAEEEANDPMVPLKKQRMNDRGVSHILSYIG